MIAPIRTLYKDILFRSRLEARWAKFFDEFGVIWEYEPETFEVDFGDNCYEQYTPDFLVYAGKNTYVEVRGDQTRMDREFDDWLRKAQRIPKIEQIVLLGNMPLLDRPKWRSWLPAFSAYKFFRNDDGTIDETIPYYAHFWCHEEFDIKEFAFGSSKDSEYPTPPHIDTNKYFSADDEGTQTQARWINSLLQRCSHVKFYD